VTTHIEFIGQAVVMFAFCSAVLFMAGYTLLAKWWKSTIGWARISLDFGIAMALSPAFLHMAFGIHVDGSPLFAWYDIAAIAFVGFVSLWNLAIVIRAQLRGHRRSDD
jgi:hypothetical protein